MCSAQKRFIVMTTASANDVMLEYYISVLNSTLKLQCEFKIRFFFSKTTVRNEGTIAWVIP